MFGYRPRRYVRRDFCGEPAYLGGLCYPATPAIPSPAPRRAKVGRTRRADLVFAAARGIDGAA